VSVFDSINWPEVLAGFILGLTPVLSRLITNIYLYARTPGKKKYRGEFWIYYHSLVERDLIRERRAVFKNSLWRRKITAKLPSDAVTGLQYRGEFLRVSGPVCYLLLSGRGHQEWLMLVFRNPLSPTFEVTKGVIACVTIENTPVAGKMILSRSQLTEADAKSKMGARTIVRGD
jgi:hypothetical protein